ncbi:hypothetical protein ROSINTL182_05337 [Roseburia intestinalis L1-82]|uniref:Uncharacterized protein n=1 Tax=Roseburia intestinalis L1-82 TaxID=536231 RepID=C7G628_9FIRM|nr:hypothetical protein [Roseburia intestinalis]EEV02715.1 hypothetical protein ROSINTL182_05337 [Roseburia intestinalis L1-82]
MIKIIAGVYGYKENGIILPKDKDSEPFSLDPEREAELVTQGVAEYANVIIPEAELEPEPETAGAEQQPAEDPAEPEAEEPEQDWSRKLTETKILRVKKQKNQSTATK